MERRIINPWTWQDQMGYVQANEVEGAGRSIYCAGQGSVDDEGRPVHPDDMGAQMSQAVDNLEAVLSGAGASLSDVVRLNIYTTDVDRFRSHRRALAPPREPPTPHPATWTREAGDTGPFLTPVGRWGSPAPCGPAGAR